ncbi:hypothetical protein V1477_007206 [Vespula maculifrons]|uniref:Uncharacterized protein n=1 Tax=Vespula maculifrons TaxID=7453 RepID=A0ABD2CII6_VESMC
MYYSLRAIREYCHNLNINVYLLYTFTNTIRIRYGRKLMQVAAHIKRIILFFSRSREKSQVDP